MKTYFHFYPFDPRGTYGGSMRVGFAALATDAKNELFWWDDETHRWVGPVDAVIAGAGTNASPVSAPPAPGYLSAAITRGKRAMFPSALWESRRHAVKQGPWDRFGPGDRVMLHTSMLGVVAPRLRRQGAVVVVDVHDLVYRVHEMDSALAAGPMRIARAAYARTIRPRERRGLKAANAVFFAGWEDHRSFQASVTHRRAFWAPTGLHVSEVPRIPSDHLRVGLIGNFAHSATSQPARDLIDSPLGKDPAVELVFAGLGSEAWAGKDGVTAMGPVKAVSQFYENVDAMVVPVENGAGMKTKLAEAALAGCPVVTTPAGAAGYAPDLRRHFLVVEGAQQLTTNLVRNHLDKQATDEIRDAFVEQLGSEAALQTYRDGLAGLTT